MFGALGGCWIIWNGRVIAVGIFGEVVGDDGPNVYVLVKVGNSFELQSRDWGL